jgi:hypothetical protein
MFAYLSRYRTLMGATLQRHPVGLTWTEAGFMARSAHAVRSQERVWLIDPFEDGPALEAAAALGRPVGVLQLLDRHNRDCAAIATRLGVSLLRLPDRVPDGSFDVVPVLSRPGWREVALWCGQERALIVSEAIGTAPAFALGRRAGVHPMLRLTPPRSQFVAYHPAMLLVGHGATIEAGADEALHEALAHSRSDLPRLLTSLPTLLRR